MISFGPPVTLPVAPSSLTGTAGASSVYLTWGDNADDEEGYYLERSTGIGGYEIIDTLSMNRTSYTDSTVAPLTEYNYRVAAYNMAGISGFSNTLTLTTPDSGALGTNITWTDLVGVAVQEDNSIIKTAGWGENNGGAASVEVLPANTDGWVECTAYATGDTRYFGLSQANTDASDSIDFAIRLGSGNGLAASEGGSNVDGLGALVDGDILRIERTGTKIEYKVNGITHYTSEVSSTEALLVDVSLHHQGGAINNGRVSFAAVPLSVPEGVVVDDWDENSITISWDDVKNEVGYIVERSSTSGSGFMEVAILQENQTIFKNENLTSETTFYYRLKAIGINDNESDYSAEINAQTSKNLNNNTDFYQTPRFNGNITAVRWKTFGDKNQKVYTYHYDAANRMTAAQYAEGTTTENMWTTLSKQGGFNVHGLTYDRNGNIQALSRQSAEENITTVDAMTYLYSSNQLMSVSDEGSSAGLKDENVSGDDYAYDDNGNLIKDLNQGITSITYNHMNLPERIDKASGEYVIYVYDAAGIKLAEEQYNANDILVKRTDYIGGFVFENNALKLIHHEEGRVVPDELNGGYEYQYDIRDHLGNNRLTFSNKPKTIQFKVNFENDGTLLDDITMFEATDPVLNIDFMDHTDKRENTTVEDLYSQSQRLNGAEESRIGSVIAIPVAAGDKITAEAYAKYINPTANDVGLVTALATSLIGAFTGGTGMSNEAVTQTINGNYTGTNGAIIGTPGFPVEDADAPMAFLNVLFLPEDEVITIGQEHFTFDQINDSAEQPVGDMTNHPFDQLTIEDFEAPGKGYMLIYLSNESSTLVDVHFDDILVTVEQKEIAQSDDFYPFGLTFNSRAIAFKF